jgi:hypothetical protein
MNTNELIRKGQLVDLKERRMELIKRIQRCCGDVAQYSFPTDPLRPVETCRIDLLEQAVKDMVDIKEKYEKVEAAIQELGG